MVVVTRSVLLLGFLIASARSWTYDPSPLCDDCVIRNGKGYNIDPELCSSFAQCFFAHGIGYAMSVPCPAGLFWHQDSLACLPADSVHCINDPCHNPSISSYAMHNDCRGYWQCFNQRTYRYRCCTIGQAYVTGVGCQTDSSCNTVCPPKFPTIDRCGLAPFPENDRKYVEIVYGDTFIRDCPSGTAFAHTVCVCGRIIAGEPVWCMAEVVVDFLGSVRDTSTNQIAVGNPNGRVSVHPDDTATDGYVGRFTGASSLTFWRFANSGYGSKLKIFIRFMEKPVDNDADDEIIISNGDCGAEPSIEIKFNRRSQTITASIMTYPGVTYSVTVSYVAGEWKDLILTYDGTSLYLGVDSQVSYDTARIPAEDPIVRVQCALHVGTGSGLRGLTACVDEVRVYLCLKNHGG